MTADQHSTRRHWGIAVRTAVTLSIVAYLVYKVDWASMVSQLARADPAWLLLACLCFGVTYVLAALRWWLLLRVQDIALPVRAVTALTFIGQFFNTFMLGSIGGDIVKAVYLQKYAPNRRTHAMLTIIMDRVLGLVVLLVGSLLAMPWQMRSMMAMDKTRGAVYGLMIVFGVIVAGAVFIAIVPFHRATPGLRRLWNRIPHHHVIELVVSGFRQHGVALELTLASVAVAVVLTLGLNLACYCIAVGIGLEVTYLQLLVIVTVAICVISLPISIGGHGVREGIFVLMFTAFGVVGAGRVDAGQETAILFSLLFFAIPLVWSVVGAIVYLTFRHEYPRIDAEIRSERERHATGW